jgi:ribA/ribD-fused uncharacterized protein
MYKVKVTDTHVYFLTGPFSQWHPSYFTVEDDGVERVYNCAEQYMMARKAMLLGDLAIHDQIMKVGTDGGVFSNDIPREQKRLGRLAGPFDPNIWTNEAAIAVVTKGNIGKFSQNEDLKKYLLDTEERHLVEGASYDKIWGVGLDWNNPKILDEKNWRGLNLLGKCLMTTRLHLSGE